MSGVDDACEYELKLSGKDQEMDCKCGTRVLFVVSMLENFAIKITYDKPGGWSGGPFRGVLSVDKPTRQCRVESHYLLFLQLGAVLCVLCKLWKTLTFNN